MLDDLSIKLHEVAVEKGFWPEEVDDILNDLRNAQVVLQANYFVTNFKSFSFLILFIFT